MWAREWGLATTIAIWGPILSGSHHCSSSLAAFDASIQPTHACCVRAHQNIKSMVAPHAYVTLYYSCSPPTSLQQPDFGAQRRNRRGRMVACRCTSMSVDSFYMRCLYPVVLLAAQPYRVGLRSHPSLSVRCAFAPGHLCAAPANTGGAHQLCILNYRMRHNSQVSSGNTMYLWPNPSCLPARPAPSTA